MVGPSSNPIVISAVITIYFLGIGYLSYVFGRMDANRPGKQTGM